MCYEINIRLCHLTKKFSNNHNSVCRLGNQFKLNVGVSKQLSEMVEVTSLGPQSTTQLVLGKESRVYLGGSSNTVQVMLSK